jgi:hypothetical protein
MAIQFGIWEYYHLSRHAFTCCLRGKLKAGAWYTCKFNDPTRPSVIHTQLLQLEKSDDMPDVILLKLDPQTGDLLYNTISRPWARVLVSSAKSISSTIAMRGTS